MSALIAVQDLRAGYGQADVLFGVTLEVEPGEVVALVGRNGAGKSTTLRAIMGLVTRRAGAIRFDGHSIEGLRPFRIARLGLGYVPEDRRIFTDLSVAENLEVGRRPGPDAWTPERLYEIFPNLAEMRGRRASQMSGGEQQMLTIARTLMGNPKAVLLDAPSEGIAPVIVDQMVVAVRRMKASGLAVLLSEQNVSFAAAVSERVYAIESGQIRFEGPASALTDPTSAVRGHLAL